MQIKLQVLWPNFLGPFHLIKYLISAVLFGGSLLSNVVHAQVASEIVYETEGQCLEYVTDAQHNSIPDFSYAGYRNGEVMPPNVPTVMRISPVSGDNTQHIQDALDQMANLPLGADGIRGALLLEAGTYTVSGALLQRASGVVLRGVGDGSDPDSNTIIRSTSTASFEDRLSVITIGNLGGTSAWRDVLPNSTSNITSPFLPLGSRTMAVADVDLYSVGDDITVTHPSTTPWLASVDFGDTGSDEPWQPNEVNIEYARTITAINRNEGKIILDVPIFDHFDRELSQAFVHRYNKALIRTNVGIESLRIDIQSRDSSDENHAYNAIRFWGVEDAWARDVTATGFSFAGFTTRAANRVSVIDSQALRPASLITGARRYNFNVEQFSSNVLYQRVRGSLGRHTFVSNGTSSASGIVFHDAVADISRGSSEGHRRWSQGILFDNIDYTNSNTGTYDVALYTRKDFGSGHGWSATHSVIWNNDTDAGYLVQNPPGRVNYAIGNKGSISSNPQSGFIELAGQQPLISSLYQTQLSTRLANPDIPDAPARLSARDAGSNNVLLRWLDIAANEAGYRVEFRPSDGEAFQLVTTVAANTTEFVHDLSGFDARDVTYRVSAVAGNSSCISRFSNPVGVGEGDTPGVPDTPDSPPAAGSLAVLADVFVRDGRFTNDNFGGETSLVVKGQTSPDYQRITYLSFDTAGLTTNVTNASLQLVVKGKDRTSGTRHVLHVVDDDSWREDSVTFSTRPPIGTFVDTAPVPTTGSTLEIDVTEAINNAVANGDRRIHFRLANAQNRSNDAFVSYHSNDVSNVNNRPRLMISH